MFKETTKLALRYTALVALILLVFSTIISVLFFNARYGKQREALGGNGRYRPPMFIRFIGGNMGGEEIIQNINIRFERLEDKFMSYHRQLGEIVFRDFNIAYNSGEYLLWSNDKESIKTIKITQFIYSQIELMQLLFLIDVVLLIGTWFISLHIAKSSLKKLNAQIQSLNDFVANASHELQTPLMMINSEIDLGLKKKDYEVRFHKLKTSTKRISLLLENLVLITKLENGVQPEMKSVNLDDLVQEVIEELKKVYPDKQILSSEGYRRGNEESLIKKKSLDKDSSSRKRSGSEGQILKANPSLLKIVIKNLIENACKYAGDGGKINVNMSQNSLSISDNGIGIAPENLSKIFDRFWQVEKTENGQKHSFGLGLFLVKKIVQLHGWKIEVKSEVGKGSEFKVYF